MGGVRGKGLGEPRITATRHNRGAPCADFRDGVFHGAVQRPGVGIVSFAVTEPLYGMDDPAQLGVAAVALLPRIQTLFQGAAAESG